MLLYFLFLALLLQVLPCSAQDTNGAAVAICCDTQQLRQSAPFPLTSMILPGALFTYGLLAVNVPALRRYNEDLKQTIWERNPHRALSIENYTAFVPALAVYGLNIGGIPGRHNLTDRTLIYGLSNVLACGISQGIKETELEQRPDGSDRASFPSNHTTVAFVAAEFLRQEYAGRVHWTVIAGGYTIAAGTGFMRMYNNKHWFGDVVAGAGIGILSTRLVYWVYPGIKSFLGRKKPLRRDMMALPTYQDGRLGLVGLMRF